MTSICKSTYKYNDIPSEILLGILSQLDSTHDLLSCAQVCKLWSYFATELLWYKPNLEAVNGSQRWASFFTVVQAKSTMFPYAFFVRRINLSSLSSMLEDLHVMALRYCKRLERLTLTDCSKLTDIGLCTVIEEVGAALISIDLGGLCQITDRTIQQTASSCPQLQGLNLSMTKPHFTITDAGVYQLAHHCRHLKRIRLNRCVCVTRDSLIPLVLYCPRLIEIDLTNCLIDDHLLMSIFEYSHELKELRISQADMAHTQLTEKPFCSTMQQPNSFQQLRLVDLTNVTTLTDKSLDRLLTAAPKVCSLALNRCSSITDEGALAITRLGRFLRYLHLGHCPLLTDRSVTQIAIHCNRIRHLDLTCCTEITDQSVTEVAKGLIKLKRIALVKCDKITDVSLEALVYFHAGDHDSLERIHLSYCVQLSTKGVAKLLNSCHHLSHLSLTQVPSFLKRDLKVFSCTPPKEMTEVQRQAFCVVRGDSIQGLKERLNAKFKDDPTVLYPFRYTMGSQS